MKYFSFTILLFMSPLVWASGINEVDSKLKQVVSSLLKRYEAPAIRKFIDNKNRCLNINDEVLNLLSCKDYLKRTYITDDIDAYVAYVKSMARLRYKPSDIPEIYRILSTEYEEVISKLYFDLADIYYKQGQYELALEYLQKIDNTLDDQSVYHALLIYGLIYFEKGDYKKAKFYLGRITDESPDYKYAKYNLALISMRSRWWSEAESYLQEAISTIDLKKITPASSSLLDRIYLTLGYSQINRKNFRQAKSSFNSVSLDGELTNRALLGLAMAEIGLGQLSKAAPLLKHIIKNAAFTDKIDALVILPQVYQHANNTQATVEYYKSALEGLNNELRNQAVKNTSDLVEMNLQDILYRKQRIKSIKSYSFLNSKEKSKIISASKILNSIIDNRKQEYIAANTRRLKSYIGQVKYALALIYDESVAQSE